MTIVCTEYLPFVKHSDVVKSRIVEKNHDINVDHEWWDGSVDSIKAGLELIGFDDINVYFSGFSCQGDGAQFVGKYSYEKGAAAKAKVEFPEWAELHELAEASRKHFYGVSFSIRSDGHYSHENCTSFNFEGYTEKRGDFWLDYDQELEFIEPCREFMKHIYRSLEKTYDALTGDDAIIETIKANEYEFDYEGNQL